MSKQDGANGPAKLAWKLTVFRGLRRDVRGSVTFSGYARPASTLYFAGGRPPWAAQRKGRMRDMFGNEITIEQARALKKRKDPVPNGYAAAPGTGPTGETCKTCQHLAKVEYAKVYRKCGLMKKQWTGGGATDVLARSPACRRWEPPPG